MNKLFDKYTPSITVLLIILVISTPFTGIILYNYWTGLIGTGHSFDGVSAVVAYASGIINIVTIIFLYINFNQQKIDNQKRNQETEFNKIVQLVQNQLVFTKDLLKEKPIDSENLKAHKEIDLVFADYYYNVIEIVFKQTNLYKRYLHNNLNDNDNSLIFSLVCVNFLDNYIDYINHIATVYENVQGSLSDKINSFVLTTAKHSYASINMISVEDVKDDDAISDSKEYWDKVKKKMHEMKNMVHEIKSTYEAYTDLFLNK